MKPGVDQSFVRPQAYTIFETLFKKGNTKLGTKVNIYLGPLPGPWKGAMQVRGPEAQAPLAS